MPAQPKQRKRTSQKSEGLKSGLCRDTYAPTGAEPAIAPCVANFDLSFQIINSPAASPEVQRRAMRPQITAGPHISPDF